MTKSTMESLRDEFFDNLASQVIEVLREMNIDEGKAEIAAAEVVTIIVAKHGGEQLYIPKDYTHKSQDRAVAVYDACNGRNHTEVARAFDISPRSVYRIYKRIKAHVIAQKQGDIFDVRQ